MRRQTHAHCRRRANRPAVLKRQILRREARKRAKYPMRTVYHYVAGQMIGDAINRKRAPKRSKKAAEQKENPTGNPEGK